MKASLKAVESKESSDVANVFELIGDPALMAVGLAAAAVEEDLPSGFQQRLERGNC